MSYSFLCWIKPTFLWFDLSLQESSLVFLLLFFFCWFFFVMESSDSQGKLNHMVGTMEPNDVPAAEGATGQKDTSPVDMLRFVSLTPTLVLKVSFWSSCAAHVTSGLYFLYRIKQQMSNQCFEMAVQLNAGIKQFSWLNLFLFFKSKNGN